MRTEGKNLRAALVIFGLGGTLAMGGVPEYAARSWLCLVLAAPAAALSAAAWVFGMRTEPALALPEGAEALLGRTAGRLFAAAVGALALVSAAQTVGGFTALAGSVTTRGIDRAAPGMAAALAAALIAGGGFRAVSGTCRVCLMPLAAVLTATVGLGLAGADLSAFPLPLLGGEPLRAAEGALGLAVSPFGELAAVFFVLPPPEKTRRGRDVWIASAELFGILAAVYLRNVLVLGGPGMETLLFRSFYALRIMDLNAFLHRTEIVLSVFYLCCDLLKLSVCLLAVEKAAGRVFGLDRPVCCGGAALVALGASQTLFRNTQALVDFQTAAKLPLAAAWGGLGLVLAAAAAVRRQKRKREKKFSLKSGAQRNII